MKKVAPLKKGDSYIYSIWNIDLKTSNNSANFMIADNEVDFIENILKEANVDYEINAPVALGHWYSNDERYLLFIKKESGEIISEDEHDYISYLLSNGQLHADIFEEGGEATCNQLVIGEGSLIYNQFGNTKRTKISQESEVEIENEQEEEKMESGGAIQTSLFFESGGQIDEEIEALDNRIASLEELYIVLNEDEQPDMRETINKLEKEKADLIRKKEKGESGEAPKKRWGFFQEGGTTPTFIKYKDNEIMFAPWINKYYVDDVEYDTLEEAQLHIDEGREGKIIYNEGGEIGFIPMDLEQQLFYVAKRGGISIKGVVGILSAMIDAGVTEEDLDITAKSGTAYQNKLDKKTLEIWNKIEPSYKGDLKGNMYYSALRELITKKHLLSKFKPYRKNQKFKDGGETDKNKPMIEELRNHFQDTAYSIESLGDNQFVIFLQVDATLDEVEQKLEILNKVHEEEWMNGIQPYSNLGINADLSSDGRQALVIEYLGETYSEGGSTEDESASAYIKAKIKNLEENLKDPNISDYQRERDEKELALFKSGEQFDGGGDVSSENAEMVLNNSKQIEHHTKELSDAVKESKHVPAWVVAKVNRSASDLSDATHYLDGENDNYAEGGETESENEDWLTQAIEDLKSEQDDDSFVVTYENELDGVKGYNVEGDSGEFLIFENEDEAKKYAIAQVKSDMEDDISMFNQDFILGYIEPKGFFRSMFDEMNESYANDIKSESDDEYPNRLIREMVERDLMTESEAQSDVAEDIAEEKQEDFVEQMTIEALEEGNDGYDYYKINFGEEEANKLMIDNHLIDLDGASEGAVQLDGVAHFLASYDGQQIDLDNGAVAYKTN